MNTPAPKQRNAIHLILTVAALGALLMFFSTRFTMLSTMRLESWTEYAEEVRAKMAGLRGLNQPIEMRSESEELIRVAETLLETAPKDAPTLALKNEVATTRAFLAEKKVAQPVR